MNRRPVRLFSIVYGERFLEWFENGCVRSLCWPRNRLALRRAVAFDLWTMPADAKRAKNAAERLGLPVNVQMLEPYKHGDDEARKRSLFRALLGEMTLCVDQSSAFFWTAPDSVFGDGTAASVMELGAVPGVCVALAPMRVRAEGFIEAMGDGPIENASLVKLAFERMHPSFEQAEATRQLTNSFESGVSWRRLADGLYAVTHLCQSAYLMQPSKSDRSWFRDFNKFGAYDHAFPRRLVEEQRQRVIGSSDAAFVAELTSVEAHVPKLAGTDPAEPDRYRYSSPQQAANRNVVCIWRAA